MLETPTNSKASTAQSHHEASVPRSLELPRVVVFVLFCFGQLETVDFGELAHRFRRRKLH